jgi:predicted RNase H-like nuclease (RuvC/YqgF family)
MILEFVKRGRPAARIPVTTEVKAKLCEHIVALDPYNPIDKQEVEIVIKKLETKEEYDFERDRPGAVYKEQFDHAVDERKIRLEMNLMIEKNNKRLGNLRDFIHFIDTEKINLQDKVQEMSRKLEKVRDREEKLKFNFEVIVYLRQGQVEVP